MRMWAGGLNPYDMFRDCAFMPSSYASNSRHRVMMRGLTRTPTQRRVVDAIIRQNERLIGDSAEVWLGNSFKQSTFFLLE